MDVIVKDAKIKDIKTKRATKKWLKDAFYDKDKGFVIEKKRMETNFNSNKFQLLL